MNTEVYDEASGEIIKIERGNMIIETVAAKAGLKVGKDLMKRMAEKLRVIFTKKARKRQGKEIINPYVIAFALLSASGCASIDRALIAVDDGLYGSSTALIATPPGYIPRPYVQDATGARVSVEGWQVRWEIIPAPTFSPTMLQDAIAKPRRQSVMGPVMELIDGQTPKLNATMTESGAADAIDKLKAEAAKEGFQ
jgi:hypothetical protein